jgi:hypothetical protein
VTPLAPHRSLPVAGLLIVELVLVAAAWQVLNPVDCAATGTYEVCRFLRSLAARALALFGAGALFAQARRVAIVRFAAAAADHPAARGWAMLHALGVGLLVAPLALGGAVGLSGAFWSVAPVLAAGAALAGVGGLFWIAPPRAWAELLRAEPVVLPLAAAVAVALPDLAELARPIWGVEGLTRATFAAVEAVLRLASAEVSGRPEDFVLTFEGFAVQISRACSGVEGFALVAGFVAIYAALFRGEVRVGRVLAVLVPIGLMLSWALNVVRIATLVLIGARVAPELAVNGFHSYAGWLFFLILALGLLWAGHAVPWFQRGRVAGPAAVAAPPLRSDPLAALILPFVVFMVASVAAGAFFPHPELGYPLTAAAMAAAVLCFLPAYRALEWRLDRVALGVGAAVGVLWVALAAPAGGDDPLALSLAAMTPAAFAAWVALRLVGTVLLVPLIEEAFFRGYVLTRIAGLGGGWALPRVAGIAVSSVLFAALHGRWVEATAAGVAFSLLMLRQGRLGDAVQAHAAANLVVAVAAALRDDWTLV